MAEHTLPDRDGATGDVSQAGAPLAGERPQARIIVISNLKGGTGKSTTALNVVVGLMRQRKAIATIDLDTDQESLSRYLHNRKRFSEAAKLRIGLPDHHRFTRTVTNSDEDPAIEDAKRLSALIDRLLEGHDYVVIDCPSRNNRLINEVLSRADMLISPVNESFVDLDVLGEVRGSPPAVSRIGPFARLINAEIDRRKAEGQRSLEWIVLRNRRNPSASRNSAAIGTVLDQLSKALPFRVVDGFVDRLIFRELFLVGLSILDLRKDDPLIAHNASHRSAYEEAEALLDFTGLLRLDRKKGAGKPGASKAPKPEKPSLVETGMIKRKPDQPLALNGAGNGSGNGAQAAVADTEPAETLATAAEADAEARRPEPAAPAAAETEPAESAPAAVADEQPMPLAAAPQGEPAATDVTVAEPAETAPETIAPRGDEDAPAIAEPAGDDQGAAWASAAPAAHAAAEPAEAETRGRFVPPPPEEEAEEDEAETYVAPEGRLAGETAAGPAIDRGRVLVIYESEGGRRHRQNFKATLTRLAHLGCDVAVHECRNADDANEFLRTVRASDYDVAFVAAGDTCILGISDRLAATGIPVAINSPKSGARLASELNLPTAPKAIAQYVVDGQQGEWWLGEANGSAFISVGAVGVAADLLYGSRRKGGGQPAAGEDEAEESELQTGFRLVVNGHYRDVAGAFFVNAQFLPRDFAGIPGAERGQRQLYVVLLERGGWRAKLRYRSALMAGRLPSAKGVHCEAVSQVSVWGGPGEAFWSDGRPLSPLPAQVRIKRYPMKLLA